MAIRWRGLFVQAGVPTGDNRLFADGALTWRRPPLPLLAKDSIGGGHAGASVVGRIESATEVDAGTWCEGTFADPRVVPDAAKAIYLAAQGVLRPSVDLETGTYTASTHTDSGGREVTLFTEATAAGATLVPIPAFAGVFITVDTPAEQSVLAALGVAADLEDTVSFTVNSSSWRGLPLAPRKALFDADDAVKRIAAWAGVGTEKASVDKYASAFLWRDGSQTGETMAQDSFRLPLGDIIDGKLTMVYHAIYAAAALVAGAHGGLPNIPEADRDRLKVVINQIYDHIRDEYKDPNILSPFEPGGGRSPSQQGAAMDDTLTAGAAPHAGAMIALALDDDDAERVAIDEEGVDELHLTFAYLGTADSVSPPVRRRIELAMRRLIDGVPVNPISASLFGLSAFNPGGDEPAMVATVNGDGLAELHAMISAELADIAAETGWVPPRQHTPWIPHVTLGYGTDIFDRLPAAVDRLGPVRFNRLRIAWGGDRVDMPLGDFARQVKVDEDAYTLTASTSPGLPDEWFTDPHLTAPTPLTITDDGRVYGHLALWGKCHVGVGDRCVMVPRSMTSYAHFEVGAEKLTSGKIVRVGKITLGTGHAHPQLGVVPARDHYDNSGWTIAPVKVFEDRYGIAFSGGLLPGTPPEKVAELRRSPLSGDWRRVDTNLELVAALAVNSPGFPVLRVAGEAPHTLLAALGPGHETRFAVGVADEDDAFLEKESAAGAGVGLPDNVEDQDGEFAGAAVAGVSPVGPQTQGPGGVVVSGGDVGEPAPAGTEDGQRPQETPAPGDVLRQLVRSEELAEMDRVPVLVRHHATSR